MDDEKAFHQKGMEDELRKLQLPWVADKRSKPSMKKKSTAKDSASRQGLAALLAKSKTRLRRKSQVHARGASHTNRSARKETASNMPAREDDSSAPYTREKMLQLAESAAAGRRERKCVKAKETAARSPHQPTQPARAPASEWSTGARRVGLNDKSRGVRWASDADSEAGIDVEASGDDDLAVFGAGEQLLDDDEDGGSDLLKHLISIGDSDAPSIDMSFGARDAIDAVMGADESFSPDRDTRLPVIAEFSPNGLEISVARAPAESSTFAETRAARVTGLKQRLDNLQSCGYAHAGEPWRLADELAEIEVGARATRDTAAAAPAARRHAGRRSSWSCAAPCATKAAGGRAPSNDRERGKNGRRRTLLEAPPQEVWPPPPLQPARFQGRQTVRPAGIGGVRRNARIPGRQAGLLRCGSRFSTPQRSRRARSSRARC